MIDPMADMWIGGFFCGIGAAFLGWSVLLLIWRR